MASKGDPDKMTQIAAFHQGLHCLLTGTKVHVHLNLEIQPVTPWYVQWTIPGADYIKFHGRIQQYTKG